MLSADKAFAELLAIVPHNALASVLADVSRLLAQPTH